MIWYDFIERLYRNFYKLKNKGNMNDEKTLYELSQIPDWHNKWSVKHPYNGQQMPTSSRLGSTLISHPADSSKLAESTRATLQGKSEPFSPSGETLSLLSKF